MTRKGRIIILNGVGTVGKSSIAKALQKNTATPFLHIECAAHEIFAGNDAGYEPRMRIGIASGPGTIGAEAGRNYIVIGDTVNLASRIEGANKLYGTSTLIGGHMADALGGRFALREIDKVLLPGIDAPQTLFEIVGREGSLSAEIQALTAAYAQALAGYRRGDWTEARIHFLEALRIASEDQPTRAMPRRIDALAASQPEAEGWGGI